MEHGDGQIILSGVTLTGVGRIVKIVKELFVFILKDILMEGNMELGINVTVQNIYTSSARLNLQDYLVPKACH